ncbi:unnamed protein product, partial [Rotaria magnacalcarata]
MTPEQGSLIENSAE